MPKSPALHPDTIEAVKQRADIVDVVSEHVVLKKQGKDFVGLCPFHDDKSPSFSVSPSKQFYYCFSCGAGGNSFKFLMELNKTSFSEVVLDLAGRYQVPVQTLEPEQRQAFQRQLSRREQLYEILAVTARFYEHALRQPQGELALSYLRDQRHLQDSTIQQFQLGYAPAGWATLYGYLVEQKHYPVQLVEQAGLIAPRKSGTGYYDRFRDRLMIPIRDPQGRVIGFGGRTLSGDEPKYLNSPETELFDKGNTLFGLDQARSAIAKFDRAVVVEGYFDVIALQAAGITNVVAALGTALGVAQVKQLLKYTESKQIIFNFDADRAGQQATERAIGAVADLAYQGQVQLRVLNLPGGKDADEYLQRASAADYRHLLDTAPLWLDWQIQQVLTQANLQEADQFQTAIQAIVQLLGKLPNAPLRTHYIHRCAELLGQGESRVTVQLEEDLRLQVRGQRWHGRSQKWERPGDAGVRELAEAQLLRIYLHVPALRDDLRSLLRERDLSFSFMPHRLLWRSILVLAEAQGGRKTDTTSDLVVQLQDAITDFPPKAANRIMAILELNEKTELDILRPQLGLRQAAATLERLESEKRCRHLLDSWQAQKVQSIERCVQQLLAQDQGTVTDLETQLQQLYQNLNTEALQFQKLFYDERQYQQTLDHQRCTSQAELVQVS